MGIIKRQSLKSSLVNYLGVFLGVVFFNFIFPHILSKEYLGLIGLFQNIMWVFAALPTLGLPLILYKYFPLWKDTGRLREFNGFAIGALALASLLFALMYYLLRTPVCAFYQSKSALFIPYYTLVIPLVVFQAYTQYFEMYSITNLRVAVPTFLKEIATRLLLILLVYLFVYHVISEAQFVYALPLIYLVSLLILVAYTWKILGFRTGNPLPYLRQNDTLGEQLGYGANLLLLSCMFSIQNFVDGIMIPAYLGLGVFGIYGRPLVLGQMIHVPFRAISQISQPVIRQAWVDNDLDKIRTLHRDISLNLLLIGGFLFTVLIADSEALFRLLPPEYASGQWVLLIIALGRLIDMGFGLNNEILYSSNHYRWIVYLSIGIVLCSILLNMWFIPIWGMNGAALAVTITLILFNLIKTWMIYHKFGIHCFSRHYISLLLLIPAVLFVMHLLPYVTFMRSHMFMNALLNVILKSGLSAVLFLLPLYFLRVSDDFNHFIRLVGSGKIFKGGHKLHEL